MAEPSVKDTEMEQMTDNMSQLMFGRKRTDAIRADICVDCGKSAKEFKNEISRKEYIISGFCQECQDKTFGPDEE